MKMLKKCWIFSPWRVHALGGFIEVELCWRLFGFGGIFEGLLEGPQVEVFEGLFGGLFEGQLEGPFEVLIEGPVGNTIRRIIWRIL